MSYRLTTASLIAATYGAAFDPTTEQAPQVLAQNLDPTGAIQDQLNKQVGGWTVNPTETSSAAISRAITEISNALTVALGQTYALQSSASTYQPIYDGSGNEIGHTTVAWVERNGVYLSMTTTTSPQITMYGCIFLSVTPDPSATNTTGNI